MNSLLERLKKYVARIDELTLRERAIVLAAMLTLLFLGWYAYLIEPLKLTEKTLIAELDKKHVQLQTLNDQFTLMADRQKQDPNALARERLQQLREEQKQMTEELRGATANLVAPELMPEVLRSMLKSADGLTLIGMRGLGSTPLLQPVADAKTAKPDGKAAPAPSEETPKLARDSGTLFERMSNIARGAAQAQAEDDEAVPGFRREPLDIPRFLNRQNNQ